MSRINYDKAPLYEVGVSLFTDGHGLVDAYDVKTLHDLFRSEFPVVEKQLPLIAGQPNVPFQVTGPEEDHHRWWFISQAGLDLIQVQSNFFGRNWRRNAMPGGAMPPYQGFDALLESLSSNWTKLTDALATAGRPIPSIIRTEIFYDNMLPAGEGLRIRDTLEGIALPVVGTLSGFNLGWSEPLPRSATGQLLVEARTVHAKAPTGESGDFLRLRFIAKDDASSMEEAAALLTEAHGVISQRLHDLTTEACKATWRG